MWTVLTTEVFDAWYSTLRDRVGARRIQARIDRAALGNLGGCAPVGEDVSEMRIHYGPGYRVHFHPAWPGGRYLLAGGDKSTQSNDIATAKALAKQL